MPSLDPNPIANAQFDLAIDDQGNEHARLGRLTWAGDLPGDVIVQVYIDHTLAATVADPQQRGVWLSLDRSRAHVIELMVVSKDDAGDDLSAWLFNETTAPRRARVELVRDPAWPPDAIVRLVFDGVVFDERPVWAEMDARPGFGGWFGESDFGYEFAVGEGWGQGAHGQGPFACDDQPLVWLVDSEVADDPAVLEVRDADENILMSETVNWPAFVV